MILYYQCQSGISGDMNLGALIDLGVPKEYFTEKLGLLNLEGYELEIYKDGRQNISGTKVDVHIEPEYNHRNLMDIYNIIDSSSLSSYVKDLSKKIFYIVAEAEAKVHKEKIEEVHFHEVGALDSIIDIIGAAICFEYLNVDKIFTSKIELGGGYVKCAHGILPVPAPATIEIMKDYSICFNGVDFEATTPTGAAIIKAVSKGAIDDINMKIFKIGVGVGTKVSKLPNVLRVYLGEIERKEESYLIECNIDDMNPEYYGSIMEDLFSIGVQDAYITPIYMKKGRPGITLSALTSEENKDKITDFILKNTSTFGVRITDVKKRCIQRDFSYLDTKYGRIKVKNGYMDGEKIKSKFEYSSLLQLAKENNMSPYQLYNKIINKEDKNE
ncbi:MAG: nickel pincer cofactor biosynthesis protein LarC [Bacillota bacterium]|nr:nickel pincer cofactor biosynthesis protein LarC [Bacillota bacterium]